MDDPPEYDQPQPTRLLVHLGAGARGSTWLPPMFHGWREMRVDADPVVIPDLLADVTDLSAIESGVADAVWMAHCLEHLYLHQVGDAIAEIYRILSDDGFLGVIVPDLQGLAEFIAGDRLHEVAYQAAAGPVTAHDIIFGHGPQLAFGRASMAHRCGFTPTLLVRKLQEVPFAEILLRRRPGYELAAVACKRAPGGDPEREALLAALQL